MARNGALVGALVSTLCISGFRNENVLCLLLVHLEPVSAHSDNHRLLSVGVSSLMKESQPERRFSPELRLPIL